MKQLMEKNEGQKCLFLFDSLLSGVCGFPVLSFCENDLPESVFDRQAGTGKGVCGTGQLRGSAHVRIIL